MATTRHRNCAAQPNASPFAAQKDAIAVESDGSKHLHRPIPGARPRKRHMRCNKHAWLSIAFQVMHIVMIWGSSTVAHLSMHKSKLSASEQEHPR